MSTPIHKDNDKASVGMVARYLRIISIRGGLGKNSMAMANIKNAVVVMKRYVEATPEEQAKLLEKNRGGAYNEGA